MTTYHLPDDICSQLIPYSMTADTIEYVSSRSTMPQELLDQNIDYISIKVDVSIGHVEIYGEAYDEFTPIPQYSNDDDYYSDDADDVIRIDNTHIDDFAIIKSSILIYAMKELKEGIIDSNTIALHRALWKNDISALDIAIYQLIGSCASVYIGKEIMDADIETICIYPKNNDSTIYISLTNPKTHMDDESLRAPDAPFDSNDPTKHPIYIATIDNQENDVYADNFAIRYIYHSLPATPSSNTPVAPPTPVTPSATNERTDYVVYELASYLIDAVCA